VEVSAGNHEMVSRTLHIQAAKVVAAHAASVGDALLGVPLLCSAGDSWRYLSQRKDNKHPGLMDTHSGKLY